MSFKLNYSFIAEFCLFFTHFRILDCWYSAEQGNGEENGWNRKKTMYTCLLIVFLSVFVYICEHEQWPRTSLSSKTTTTTTKTAAVTTMSEYGLRKWMGKSASMRQNEQRETAKQNRYRCTHSTSLHSCLCVHTCWWVVSVSECIMKTYSCNQTHNRRRLRRQRWYSQPTKWLSSWAWV